MIRTFKFLGALAIALALVAVPIPSFAGVSIGLGISVNFGPPALPVYVQPPCPVVNDIWTPGYWAYGRYGYFWVPATWVAPPRPGYLWTPGYWGFASGLYAWHPGYWGPYVGFYGGVNYGFGYTGIGYVGGGWFGNEFHYNTAVTNVDRTVINNVYVNRTVVNNYNDATVNRVSYNGGPGGIAASPTPQEAAYRSEPSLPATAIQQQHVDTAAQNRNYLANVNHGRPENAAFVTPLNRENRPDNVAPATADRNQSGHANDPFARFDRQSAAANRAENSSGLETRSSPLENRTPSTYQMENAYHAANAHRPANAYLPENVYHRANAYRRAAANRAANGNRTRNTPRTAALHSRPY